MTIEYKIHPNAIESFHKCLKTLDKYKNLENVRNFIEDMQRLIRFYSSIDEPGFPPLPPIAEIPTDDLLKEIKRRIEYHGGPIA